MLREYYTTKPQAHLLKNEAQELIYPYKLCDAESYSSTIMLDHVVCFLGLTGLVWLVSFRGGNRNFCIMIGTVNHV
jgi:hypothetical protein